MAAAALASTDGAPPSMVFVQTAATTGATTSVASTGGCIGETAE